MWESLNVQRKASIVKANDVLLKKRMTNQPRYFRWQGNIPDLDVLRPEIPATNYELLEYRAIYVRGQACCACR